MLGLDTKREIAAMLSGMKADVPMAGFYSYGEIGPLDSTQDGYKAARFHNTTLVLCALAAPSEAAAPIRESAAMLVATDAMTKQERVLTRKVEQLQRKLEQIDKVASENEKVSSNVYRELDALFGSSASRRRR